MKHKFEYYTFTMKKINFLPYPIALLTLLQALVLVPETQAALAPKKPATSAQDVYDYTTQETSIISETITDEDLLDIEDIPDELNMINRKGNVTEEQLLCAIFKHKEEDDYIKYLFNSQGTWNPKAQKRPHQLGYHLVQAPAGHVLLQALAFLQTQHSYDVYGLFLPTKSPLCISCGSICANLFGHQVAMNRTGCRKRPFPTGPVHRLATKCFHSNRFQDSQRRLVTAKIGEKCFAKTSPTYQRTEESQLILAVRMSFPLDIIQMLIQSTDINALDKSKKTALDYAKNKEVYTLLRSHGAQTSQELEAARKKKQATTTSIYEDNSDQEDEKEDYPTHIVKDQRHRPRFDFDQEDEKYEKEESPVPASPSDALYIPKSLKDMRFFPSPYEYAVLSKHVYRDDVKPKDRVEVFVDQDLYKLHDWEIHTIFAFKEEGDNILNIIWKKLGRPNGYRGILYKHRRKKQMVLANRGTKPANLSAVKTDVKSIACHQVGGQEIHSIELVKEACIIACQEGMDTLSFTGHSLGGWLAQVHLFIFFDQQERLQQATDKKTKKLFVKAVTFDTPGFSPMLNELSPNINK